MALRGVSESDMQIHLAGAKYGKEMLNPAFNIHDLRSDKECAHPYGPFIPQPEHEIYQDKYGKSWEWLRNKRPGLSIQACEIQEAWLMRPEKPAHALVYARHPKYLINVPKDYINVFSDDFSAEVRH